MHGLKVNTVKTQLLIAAVSHMYNVLAMQGILGRAGGGRGLSRILCKRSPRVYTAETGMRR